MTNLDKVAEAILQFAEQVPVGTVFDAGSGRGYWKVTGVPYLRTRPCYNTSNPSNYAVPVVKCNANGKEFQQRNGYALDFVMKIATENKKVVAVGNKASTAGKEIGIKKRRVKWLEETIASHQKELDELRKELSNG